MTGQVIHGSNSLVLHLYRGKYVYDINFGEAVPNRKEEVFNRPQRVKVLPKTGQHLRRQDEVFPTFPQPSTLPNQAPSQQWGTEVSVTFSGSTPGLVYPDDLVPLSSTPVHLP